MEMTKEQCRKQLFNLGITLGVSPKLVGLRLLSDLDKNDMLLGLLPETSLRAHTEVWRDNGMTDYCLKEKIAQNANLEVLEGIPEGVNGHMNYRKPFQPFIASD